MTEFLGGECEQLCVHPVVVDSRRKQTDNRFVVVIAFDK